MDRNQVIGFALLAALLIGYIAINQHEQSKYEEQKKAYITKLRADSVANAKLHPPVVDTVRSTAASPAQDSAAAAARQSLPAGLRGEAKTVMLENRKVAIKFNTKGAFPISGQIKEYKTYTQKPLYLFDGAGNFLKAALPYDNGRSTETIYFEPVVKSDATSSSIDFVGDLGDGKKVDIIYTLPADDYMMQCKIVLTGMTAGSPLKLNWQTQGLHTEKDMVNERMNTQVYYRFKNGDNDYFTIRGSEVKNEKSDKSTAWIGFRKQYFSTVLLCEDGFTHMDVKGDPKADDSVIVAQTGIELMLPMKVGGNEQTGTFRWFLGPNDYKILKSYGADLEDMVPLGFGVMAFVKYINKFMMIPIFYFLGSFISNYALIIVIMTVLIRILLSFFTYKSYLSAAKMRVLKPELDELRARVGGDQQKMSMEQMKLYKSAGVNPLGGCVPLLFQIPILLSMYNMFPSFIEFRQKSFLWADDLSSYDSIWNFHFNIPWYGDHMSLFTLLMTATSLFLAVYNKNMTQQDPNNPMMKYMPYIFPIMLMGMFNKMAAALTFYYTLSNLLAITQQFVIQKYFINEKAIHAQIQENRNKPAAPSKWSQKLEELQKAQAEKNKVQPRINKK